MYNQLTRADIEKIREEIEHRKLVVRKEAIEAVKEARAQGDLSENFEYKMAKQAKNKNESRIRYLKNMIKTAKVIENTSEDDQVGIFDKVTLYMEDDDEREEYTLVTNIRVNVLEGLISTESPVGKAIFGKKVGDRVEIAVNDSYSYWAVIEAVEKGSDDGSIPLKEY